MNTFSFRLRIVFPFWIFLFGVLSHAGSTTKSNQEIEALAAQVRWATGQVIGVSEANGPIALPIQVANRHPINHVGMIEATNEGIFVHELTPQGARRTPLRKFLYRTMKDSASLSYIVSQPKPKLTSSQQRALVRATDELRSSGLRYNPQLVSNDTSVTSSEYIMRAFAKVGMSVGRVRALRFLNTGAFGGLLFPLLKVTEPDGEVVAPSDLLFGDMEWVAGNLEDRRVWSDEEILALWESRGDFAVVSKDIARSSRTSSSKSYDTAQFHKELRDNLKNETPLKLAEREAIKDIGRLISPYREISQLTIVETLNLPIPVEQQLQIEINGRTIETPLILFDLLDFLESIQREVDRAGHRVEMVVEGSGFSRTFTFQKPALGKGGNGIVYASGSDVVKLTLPTYRAVLNQILEGSQHAYWFHSGRESGHFTVPARHFNHALGFLAVSELDTGMSLTEYLIRKNMVLVGHDGVPFLNPDPSHWTISEADRAKIESAIIAIMTAIKQSPEHTISGGPNNIHIHVSPAYPHEITKVSIIDVGGVGVVPEAMAYVAVTTLRPEAIPMIKALGITPDSPAQDFEKIPGVRSFQRNGTTFLLYSELSLVKGFDGYLGFALERIKRYFKTGEITASLNNYLDLERKSEISRANQCISAFSD